MPISVLGQCWPALAQCDCLDQQIVHNGVGRGGKGLFAHAETECNAFDKHNAAAKLVGWRELVPPIRDWSIYMDRIRCSRVCVTVFLILRQALSQGVTVSLTSCARPSHKVADL